MEINYITYENIKTTENSLEEYTHTHTLGTFVILCETKLNLIANRPIYNHLLSILLRNNVC